MAEGLDNGGSTILGNDDGAPPFSSSNRDPNLVPPNQYNKMKGTYIPEICGSVRPGADDFRNLSSIGFRC